MGTHGLLRQSASPARPRLCADALELHCRELEMAQMEAALGAVVGLEFGQQHPRGRLRAQRRSVGAREERLGVVPEAVVARG